MSHHPERGLTVIFKGTSRCDAGCRYCSVGSRAGGTISWEDFELVVSQLRALIQQRGITRLEFTFHGGEPTLLGAGFLDRACCALAQLPVRLGLSLQSNLLSWNDELWEVLATHGVCVGTSFDPLGSSRLDAQGAPAHDRWRENYLRLAAQADAPGAIFVVTRDALGRADEVLSAAAEMSSDAGRPFGLQINPIYPQGRAKGDAEALITPEEFGGFLIDAWELWERRGRDLRLTPIQQFAARLVDGTRQPASLSCSFGGQCGTSHVGIDHELNVAGCGRRLDSGAFLGNLRDGSLTTLMEDSQERRVLPGRDSALRDGACRECRFFDLCHGGCPDDAVLAGGGLLDAFPWCASYHALFEVMERRGREVREKTAGRTVRVVSDPAVALGRGSTGGGETWLLPHPDGLNLGFEGGLTRLLSRRGERVLAFVHNRHTRVASLWERPLRDGRLQLALFELDGLEEAMSLLEKLGATIWLDVPGLVEQGGATVLARALERFMHEPSWRAQIMPFAGMLEAGFGEESPRIRSRWGLEPGAVELDVRVQEQHLEPSARAVLQTITGLDPSLAEWLDRRAPCRSCTLLSLCGASLAPGDGRACSPAERAMVGRLDHAAGELRLTLEQARAPA